VALASALAWLTALAGALPAEPIAMGCLGYNAMILAAALHARHTSIVYAIGGVMASVWLSSLCREWGVIALSAPFLAAAWLTMLLTRGRRSEGR
jgi:urea transporter